jgi:transcriptional regulator with XRE-family HTH domain
MNNFATRLKDLLETLKLTHQQFAATVGVDASRISQWKNESLPLKPNLEQFASMAKVYNVNINWLIIGEGEMFLKNADNNLVNEKAAEYFTNDQVKELQRQLLECREETLQLYRKMNKTIRHKTKL